jgi:hypothetical protein
VGSNSGLSYKYRHVVCANSGTYRMDEVNYARQQGVAGCIRLRKLWWYYGIYHGFYKPNTNNHDERIECRRYYAEYVADSVTHAHNG